MQIAQSQNLYDTWMFARYFSEIVRSNCGDLRCEAAHYRKTNSAVRIFLGKWSGDVNVSSCVYSMADNALLWNPFGVVYIIVQRQLAIYTWPTATAEIAFQISSCSPRLRIRLPSISRNKYIDRSRLLDIMYGGPCISHNAIYRSTSKISTILFA